MNRGSFVRATAAAAAAAAFLRDAAMGSASSEYVAVMQPIVETILPIGTPDFPNVEGAHIVTRIDGLYGLGKNATFLASLETFCDISSFATGTRELFATELATVGSVNVPDLVGRDSLLLRASTLPPASTFEGLSATARPIYLRLWEQSAFNTRRRFYGSLRAVTYAALYSMPESWNSIGYAGPLLHRNSTA